MGPPGAKPSPPHTALPTGGDLGQREGGASIPDLSPFFLAGPGGHAQR